MLNGGCNWGNRSELLGVLMRWSLQLLPFQLWPNTTRGSKIFVTKAEYRISAFGWSDGYGSDAEYRCPRRPRSHISDFRNGVIRVISAIPAWPLLPQERTFNAAFMSTRPKAG